MLQFKRDPSGLYLASDQNTARVAFLFQDQTQTPATFDLTATSWSTTVGYLAFFAPSTTRNWNNFATGVRAAFVQTQNAGPQIGWFPEPLAAATTVIAVLDSGAPPTVSNSFNLVFLNTTWEGRAWERALRALDPPVVDRPSLAALIARFLPDVLIVRRRRPQLDQVMDLMLTIKAGAYPGTDKDNAIAEVWNLIVTGDKMSNDDAYAIVKTLVEKKADIVAVHKEAESFSLDNQVQERSPVPFHPGALKYFKEKGVGG